VVQPSAPSVEDRAIAPRDLTAFRPKGRPKGLKIQRIAIPKGLRTVCDTPGLVGRYEAEKKSPHAGCGIRRPVRLHQVSGVTLNQKPLLNCRTAQAFKRWVDRGAKPAVRGKISSIRVVAHYACRTRNNRKGAKLSEHAKGNAIDIASITTSDGRVYSVLKDWRTKEKGRALRQMHRAACGPFGTVLGPNSDRFHQDHFHFDTARHRGGPYCR
jgi:hypothetical protein